MKVIVTGGASGIGREVGNYLMSKSYEVISVDLQEEHGAIKLDVVNEGAWDDLFQQFGPVPVSYTHLTLPTIYSV